MVVVITTSKGCHIKSFIICKTLELCSGHSTVSDDYYTGHCIWTNFFFFTRNIFEDHRSNHEYIIVKKFHFIISVVPLQHLPLANFCSEAKTKMGSYYTVQLQTSEIKQLYIIAQFRYFSLLHTHTWAHTYWAHMRISTVYYRILGVDPI